MSYTNSHDSDLILNLSGAIAIRLAAYSDEYTNPRLGPDESDDMMKRTKQEIIKLRDMRTKVENLMHGLPDSEFEPKIEPTTKGGA